MKLHPQIAIAGTVLAALGLAVSAIADPAPGTLSPPPSEKQLRTLFAQLGSDDFATRLRAQDNLQKLAGGAREQVLGQSLETYLDSIDPEVRYRLRAAMFNIVAADLKGEGFIGIRMMDAPMRILNGGNIVNERAVQILTVIEETAAARSGLRPGDRILKLDGNEFGDKLPAYIELSEYIRSKSAGEKVTLSIKRGLQDIEVELQLGERPEGLDEGRKERAFAEWMESELIDRGHLPKKAQDAPSNVTPERKAPVQPPSELPFPIPRFPRFDPKP